LGDNWKPQQGLNQFQEIAEQRQELPGPLRLRALVNQPEEYQSQM
jgi:hypothetical protein